MTFLGYRDNWPNIVPFISTSLHALPMKGNSDPSSWCFVSTLSQPEGTCVSGTFYGGGLDPEFERKVHPRRL